MARLILALLAAAFPLAAAAQTFTVIRAGRLVDVDQGQIRRDQLVLVAGRLPESGGHGSETGLRDR
jgi:hypothetical protein